MEVIFEFIFYAIEFVIEIFIEIMIKIIFFNIGYLFFKIITIGIFPKNRDDTLCQFANIDSIGVIYGYNYNENISFFNPNIIVDNFIIKFILCLSR